MDSKKESTLKSVLSALWNLSAHCGLNKVCPYHVVVEYGNTVESHTVTLTPSSGTYPKLPTLSMPEGR